MARICRIYDFKKIKGIKLGWSLIGPPMMMVYFYIFDDLMIDTGQPRMEKQVLEIIRNHPVKRIFLTHYHEDHSGNAAAIKKAAGAMVYGHALTKEKMSVPFKILPYQKYMWGNALPLNVEIVPKSIETRFGEMVPIHTPGHSKDHTCYFLKDAGILFSGDLYLADKIKFFRADEDMGLQIASLKKILTLDFHTILCGHHPKHESGRKRIRKKLEFLENLYGRIIFFKKKGMNAKQIFKAMNLKEDYKIKCFCFGNVSMINGVRSAIRYYETNKGLNH